MLLMCSQHGSLAHAFADCMHAKGRCYQAAQLPQGQGLWSQHLSLVGTLQFRTKALFPPQQGHNQSSSSSPGLFSQKSGELPIFESFCRSWFDGCPKRWGRAEAPFRCPEWDSNQN